MKRAIVAIVAICVIFTGAFAGEENVITNLYSGYLTYTSYDEDLNVINGTDWRVGGAIELPMKIGMIKAYSVFGDGFSITGYAWKVNRFQVGKIAKPMTYHRPWPVSSGSHFEPPSIAAMPGGGLGMDYMIGNEDNHLRVAVHETKNLAKESIPEYGISALLLGSVRASAYGNSEKSGIAGAYNGPKLSANVYLDSDSTVTNFLNYYVSEKVAVFSDFNLCPQGLKKYEAGAYVDATGKVKAIPLNVLLGAGIIYRDPAVDPTQPELTFNLYIFVNQRWNRK